MALTKSAVTFDNDSIYLTDTLNQQTIQILIIKRVSLLLVALIVQDKNHLSHVRQEVLWLKLILFVLLMIV